MAAQPLGSLDPREVVFDRLRPHGCIGIAEIAEAHDCFTVLDDAHGFGVLGREGRGTVDHFGLNERVDVVCGSLSKALASTGGFVSGSRDVIEFLRSHSKQTIFSAALSPSQAACAIAALDVMQTEPQHLERLWANTRKYRAMLKQLGLDLWESETPAVPIVLAGDVVAVEGRTVRFADGEQEKTLSREFKALEATAETGDLNTIRSAIHETVDSALRGFEEIRRAREITIAQLQDEIRSLHREVEHERRAAHEDPATHLWNRAKLDARIQDLVLLNETFCVFIIGIRNLTQLGARDSRLPSDCMRAFAKRLTNLVAQSGEIGMVGRWSEDCVAIVFNLPLAGAPLPMEQLHATLGGAYSIQLDGVSHTVQLALRIQPIERPKGSNEGAFYLSLGQAAFSVTAH